MLDDVTVVELAGIGPGPHLAMMLADLGAVVHRIERPGANEGLLTHTLRGRSSVVEADLKDPADLASVRSAIERSDVVIEGFRPGVADRLGLGWSSFGHHPGLIYVSVTGWGQTGPYATTAGHDITYLARTGVLDAIGPEDRPWPPINLVGDFGGCSTFGVIGVLAALHARQRTGLGCHVDAAMVDGVPVLAQHLLEMRASGRWIDQRARNLLDGGAPFYRTYPCRDGRFVAVGAIEERFYRSFLAGLQLDSSDLPDQHDTARWPELAGLIGARLLQHTRDEWAAAFSGTDACVTPVLTFAEAAHDPQVGGRGSIAQVGGDEVAGTAPRFRYR